MCSLHHQIKNRPHVCLDQFDAHIPNLSQLHTDDILIATLCMFRKAFTVFFSPTLYTSAQRLQHGAQKHFTELKSSFSLGSGFPCLLAQRPALHSLMWSRTLTPVRPEQLQPLRDCHCWAVGTAGFGL